MCSNKITDAYNPALRIEQKPKKVEVEADGLSDNDPDIPISDYAGSKRTIEEDRFLMRGGAELDKILDESSEDEVHVKPSAKIIASPHRLPSSPVSTYI